MLKPVRTLMARLVASTLLAEDAAAHAHKIVERWDVPHEVEIDGQMVPVPPDLNDQSPRMWGLADGGRISAVLALDEYQGGPSPAAPLLLMLAPAAVAVSIFFSGIFSPLLWLGLVAAVVATVVAARACGGGIAFGMLLFSVLPFLIGPVGRLATHIFAGHPNHAAQFALSGLLWIVVVPVLVVGGIAAIFSIWAMSDK